MRQAIKYLRGKMDRLKGLYLEGDVSRSGYNEWKAAIQTAIAEWTAKLGSVDYNIEAILEKLENLAEAVYQGTPGQQKCAIYATLRGSTWGSMGKQKRPNPKRDFS